MRESKRRTQIFVETIEYSKSSCKSYKWIYCSERWKKCQNGYQLYFKGLWEKAENYVLFCLKFVLYFIFYNKFTLSN